MTLTFFDELPPSHVGNRNPKGPRLPEGLLDTLRENEGRYAIIPGYKGISVPPALKRLTADGFVLVTRRTADGNRAIFAKYDPQHAAQLTKDAAAKAELDQA